mmetsp:Transcript_91109/g.260173  ORF Transcript_91109/g.260173 Transcript_91109/m.260173 type:complete len:159 (+) Transcript_91109:113-589(+)|eukprot:CAMPEP_0119544194 /NCGR_PEP_ID=MMETSP1344-20130328/54582_1 /TAXON_ID=236787 /ORGANISM="Florenciella parvula, Strain CCMP2471" /LENGTH=158 /DNA_ID=CAMNT_0007588651 /DNA_START=83 /DNA_END=559 /DNA_ORIENTATION=+
MGADNTILILDVCVAGRRVYVVQHVQADENFEDPNWVLWWFSKFSPQYFEDRADALRAARRLLEECEFVEYGIKELHVRADFRECELHRGRAGRRVVVVVQQWQMNQFGGFRKVVVPAPGSVPYDYAHASREGKYPRETVPSDWRQIEEGKFGDWGRT